MSVRRWLLNPYVLLVILMSLVAAGMAMLALLLLPSPAEKLLIMQRKSVALRTVAVQADVRYRGTRTERDAAGNSRVTPQSVAFTTAAWVDRNDVNVARGHQQFDLRLGEDNQQFVGRESRIGDWHYLRLSALPATLGPLRLDALRNQDLAVDGRRLGAASDLPVLGGENRLTPTQRGVLLREFGRTPFFRVAEVLKPERIGGTPVEHYKVSVEPLYVKDFYRKLEEARLGRELTQKERAAADTFFANLSAQDGEVWFGKGDYLLRRLRLRVVYADGKRDGTLDLNADLANFNGTEPPEVAPVQNRDVTELLISLLPGITGHLPLANDGGQNVGSAPQDGGLPITGGATVVTTDTDGDGLPDDLEAFYGSNPNVTDSDGDGASDGDEVGRGDNPTGPGKLFDFTGGRFE